MNFSSAGKVAAILDSTDVVERLRSENRDKINRAINGFPPLTAEAAKKVGLRINVNWLEETVIVKQACLQYANAFQSQSNFFTVSIPSAPPEKKKDWELAITQAINKPLKESREYASLLDNRWSSVVAHGIAPQIWLSSDKWLPDFIAINDFRVATDTETSLRNLVWFGVRRRYTVGELVDRVFGKYADAGWNKKAVIEILAAYWDKNFENVSYDWTNSPEKMTELIKQNIIFYNSDAVPVITLWHFYHQDDEPGSKKWMMKVVPDKSVRATDRTTFLFDSDEPVADKLDELLHVQYGDLTGNPPHMHQSVRSLGFMIHEACYWMNLTRCRLLQYTWENFNMILRGADGGDRARAQKVELFDKGWLPNDVSVVPKEQRHQIDQGMVELVMAQMKQLMGEASASYVQDVDTGTNKEQTAFEVSVKLQQVNALMKGLLLIAARNETFSYREICRRFCNKKSLDPDIRKFWKRIKRAGIPPEFIDVDLWNVSPDMPLGNGNQTLEMAQAQQLFQNRAAYSPQAQQEILHIYTAAMTQNAKLAQQLAPIGSNLGISEGQAWASAIFGTIMQGVPVPVQPNINPIDQIETLLGLTSGVIQRIENTDNVGTPEELIGLSTVMSYVQTLIAQLAQDPAQKQAVKQFSDDLGNLTNIVKGFAQRQKQQSEAQSEIHKTESISIKFSDLNQDTKNAVLQSLGLPPSQMPETDPKIVKAVNQLKISEEKHQQKMRQSQESFTQSQVQDAAKTKAEIEKKGLEAGVDLAHSAAQPPTEKQAQDA